MWLLVDDQKYFNVAVIARTAKAAKKLLKWGTWEVLMIDFDLGGPKTGLDVLRYAIATYNLPPKVQIVTMNSVGRGQMEAELVDAGYVKEGNFFVKARKKDATGNRRMG